MLERQAETEIDIDKKMARQRQTETVKKKMYTHFRKKHNKVMFFNRWCDFPTIHLKVLADVVHDRKPNYPAGP